jgi:hypothetical protein
MYVDHPETFADLPVVQFGEGDAADPTKVAWRLGVEEEDSDAAFAAMLDRFLATVDGKSVTALLIGEWGEAFDNAAPVELLTAKLAQMPNLRALFLGDMTGEECEISWIQHDDITPLIEVCPALEILTVRGAAGLEFTPERHATLRTLVFESGGLPADVVRGVGAADLPNVTHLELWLGTSNYGGDATVEDLSDILAGTRLPALRHLGLRDAVIADEVAAAVASAPVVARLETLDLSMGILSDRGARALLAGQPLTHLRALNLEHHYMSEEMTARVVAELPGVSVNVGDRQTGEEGHRWIAVSE